MGCSYEAANFMNLYDDDKANIILYKRNNNESLRLPRNCNNYCMIKVGRNQQRNKQENAHEEDGPKVCKNNRNENLNANNHDDNDDGNCAIFEPLKCQNSLRSSNASKSDVESKAGPNESRESICLDFQENTNDQMTTLGAGTILTAAIQNKFNKKNDCNSPIIKEQYDNGGVRVSCEQYYPLTCHKRIGCCMQQQNYQNQQQEQQIIQHRQHHLTSLNYSKSKSDCHYCHNAIKLQQLIPSHKCHHHHHKNYHYHHHHNHNHNHNHHYHHHLCHIQSAIQTETIDHQNCQNELYNESPIENWDNNRTSLQQQQQEQQQQLQQQQNVSTASSILLASSSSSRSMPIVGHGKNNNYHDSNANKYNCPLQEKLSQAYKNTLTNAIACQRLHCNGTNAAYNSHYSDSYQTSSKRQGKQHSQFSSVQIKRSNNHRHHTKENRSNKNKMKIKGPCKTIAAATNACITSAVLNANSNSASGHPITSSPAHRSTICKTAFVASSYNFISNNYYYMLRNSFNLYAASSVLFVLCYLTAISAAAAASTKSETSSIDKHPVMLLDWSKFDESSSDKEILDLLLEKKRYDKRLLPPVNDEDFCCGMSSPEMVIKENARRPHHRGTLTVNVNVLLLSLASPDESSLKYEVEFLLNQQWNDPRLEYGNKSHYDFLNALHHHESIWTPDTYFIMHGDFKDPIIPMHFALRIYRNGTITYAMRRHLILSCQGSLHIFPFDDPKCSFSMESISYEESQIKYVWKNDEDTLRKSPSLTTLNAYLIRNKTTPCDQNSWRGNYSCLRVDLIFTRDRAFYFTTVFIPGIILVTSSFITFWLEWNAVPARSMIGNYSCLQVELTFTRDRAYYFTTVFIPGIILVTSSFITFWLEWNAVPARVMIGVTTMLNFFTTSNGFRSTLPVVSNLTAMNVWDGVCMCFIYASLLEFVCVNYMGRKRPQHNAVYRPGENPVTQRLPAVLSRIGVILASPLVVIEREFHAALHSQREAARMAALQSGPATSLEQRSETKSPRRLFHQDSDRAGSGGDGDRTYRTAASITESKEPARERRSRRDDAYDHTYCEPEVNVIVIDREFEAGKQLTTTPSAPTDQVRHLKRLHSMSTNTPPLILRSDLRQADMERAERQIPIAAPLKPPRKKTSRSTSPSVNYDPLQATGSTSGQVPLQTGEKKRDTGGPNEIVACTTCGGSSSSPCTHSANNGCATEVRKKEPPHPIRIAKTIDVIARITFPTAYAIFLIFFFVHYKGFS